MDITGRSQVQLYSGALTDFCKDNTLYLDLLKDHVEELDRLKQYNKQLKESKTENEIYRQSKAADPRNLAVMFAQMGPADRRLFNTAAKSGEYEDMLTSHHQAENPFCYLCTTIEQHKRHVMKTEKRIHGKKRIPYEAPPPFVPPKPPPPKPESKDCLFKVTVKTGVDIEAACSAPVYIALQGKEDKLKKARLVKKFGSLGFFFDSGSTEVFHLRGPLIGKLERLVLTVEQPEEASEERRQKWLVESVTVKDYSLGVEYHFAINKWLRHGVSKRSGERRDQLRLAPTSTAKSASTSGRGLHVIVHTGRKATSGTDCRVNISFLGTNPNSGKARHELRQPPEEERIFQPGSKDLFELYIDDFGDLKGIRLEIDPINIRLSDKAERKSSSSKTSTASKSWFVDQVIVKDIKTGQKWLFTISDWLNEENPIKEFWTVKDVEDKDNSVYSRTTVYEIVTKTGKKDFAGTDSTIYLSLFDKENRRCDIKLVDDEDKSKFEKGKVDKIRETGRVIDTPERIKISISGKGIAPDWHMDGIEVTKYLVADEILQYLQRLQFSNKMPDGLTQEKGKILFDRPDGKQKRRSDVRSTSGERASQGKKKFSRRGNSSGRDMVDGDILGRRDDRSAAIRRSLAKKKDSDDSDEEEELSDSDDPSENSVESHDDFVSDRGMVRLPYGVRVKFAPRNEKEGWVTKDKSLELRASGPGELLFSDLRLRCDNESFERFRKELMEKKRAEDEEKTKHLREKKLKQQQQKKPGSRSSSRSRGKGAATSDSSESSEDEARKKSVQGRTSANRKPLPPSSNSVKKAQPPKRRDSSFSESSDSSVTPFGNSKTVKHRESKKPLPADKKLGSGVGSLDDRRQAKSAAGDDQRRGLASKTDGSQKTGLASDSKRGLDHVDFGRGRDMANRSRDGFDLDRSIDKNRVGQGELGKGLDRRSPRELDKGRGFDLEKDRARSPFDLDKGRGLDKDLDRGRGRLDSEKGPTRSPRDLDKGPGRFEPDRGALDLDRGRGRLDSERGRSPLDLDKGRGLDKDLDRGRGRLDSERGRSPLDLDKGRGLDKDLDRGWGRLDSEKVPTRSPRDLDKGKGRFEPDRGPDRSALDLDKGRGGRMDFDRGRQDRPPLDFDRGRSGHLDLDKGRGGLDKNLDRNRDQFDLNRNRGGRASPFDKPQIVVTGSDGRSAEPAGSAKAVGRVKPRSFNLD